MSRLAAVRSRDVERRAAPTAGGLDAPTLHLPDAPRPCGGGYVSCWPIATNFSLAPDVSFWGEAEVGRAAEFAASVEDDP